MAHPVLSESKHIIKRIAIGVITGVSGAAVIYFLGFTKSKHEPSELELKKNTTEAWKAYVKVENNLQTNLDTFSARRTRDVFLQQFLQADSLMKDYKIQNKAVPGPVRKNYNRIYHRLDSMYKAYLQEDTLLGVKFKKELEEVKARPDIDKEFTILLGTRIAYQDELNKIYINFKTRLASIILDTTVAFYEKFDQATENNTTFTNSSENMRERIGRSVEDIASSLSIKYKTPFPLSDFKFYASYIMLKKEKNKPLAPDVAPPTPDKPGSDMPN